MAIFVFPQEIMSPIIAPAVCVPNLIHYAVNTVPGREIGRGRGERVGGWRSTANGPGGGGKLKILNVSAHFVSPPAHPHTTSLVNLQKS